MNSSVAAIEGMKRIVKVLCHRNKQELTEEREGGEERMASYMM